MLLVAASVAADWLTCIGSPERPMNCFFFIATVDGTIASTGATAQSGGVVRRRRCVSRPEISGPRLDGGTAEAAAPTAARHVGHLGRLSAAAAVGHGPAAPNHRVDWPATAAAAAAAAATTSGHDAATTPGWSPSAASAPRDADAPGHAAEGEPSLRRHARLGGPILPSGCCNR